MLTLDDLGIEASATVDMSVDHLGRLAATLDRAPLSSGDPLPLLWHWSCFTPTAPMSDLADDGHPTRSDALASFPRRMWGSGRVELTSPLRAGIPAERRTHLAGQRTVDGASGQMVLVTLGHAYHQAGRRCIDEDQILVYRGDGPAITLPQGEPDLGDLDGRWHHVLRPDARLLFRFSASTFNTHRIHYDLAYALDIEGYPGLVVHGPLSAMLLADAAASDAGRALSWFEFRAVQPLFAGLPIVMSGRLDGAQGEATIVRNDGSTAMHASYGVGS